MIILNRQLRTIRRYSPFNKTKDIYIRRSITTLNNNLQQQQQDRKNKKLQKINFENILENENENDNSTSSTKTTNKPHKNILNEFLKPSLMKFEYFIKDQIKSQEQQLENTIRSIAEFEQEQELKEEFEDSNNDNSIIATDFRMYKEKLANIKYFETFKIDNIKDLEYLRNLDLNAVSIDDDNVTEIVKLIKTYKKSEDLINLNNNINNKKLIKQHKIITKLLLKKLLENQWFENASILILKLNISINNISNLVNEIILPNLLNSSSSIDSDIIMMFEFLNKFNQIILNKNRSKNFEYSKLIFKEFINQFKLNYSNDLRELNINNYKEIIYNLNVIGNNNDENSIFYNYNNYKELIVNFSEIKDINLIFKKLNKSKFKTLIFNNEIIFNNFIKYIKYQIKDDESIILKLNNIKNFNKNLIIKNFNKIKSEKLLNKMYELTNIKDKETIESFIRQFLKHNDLMKINKILIEFNNNNLINENLLSKFFQNLLTKIINKEKNSIYNEIFFRNYFKLKDNEKINRILNYLMNNFENSNIQFTINDINLIFKLIVKNDNLIKINNLNVIKLNKLINLNEFKKINNLYKYMEIIININKTNNKLIEIRKILPIFLDHYYNYCYLINDNVDGLSDKTMIKMIKYLFTNSMIEIDQVETFINKNGGQFEEDTRDYHEDEQDDGFNEEILVEDIDIDENKNKIKIFQKGKQYINNNKLIKINRDRKFPKLSNKNYEIIVKIAKKLSLFESNFIEILINDFIMKINEKIDNLIKYKGNEYSDENDVEELIKIEINNKIKIISKIFEIMTINLINKDKDEINEINKVLKIFLNLSNQNTTEINKKGQDNIREIQLDIKDEGVKYYQIKDNKLNNIINNLVDKRDDNIDLFENHRLNKLLNDEKQEREEYEEEGEEEYDDEEEFNRLVNNIENFLNEKSKFNNQESSGNNSIEFFNYFNKINLYVSEINRYKVEDNQITENFNINNKHNNNNITKIYDSEYRIKMFKEYTSILSIGKLIERLTIQNYEISNLIIKDIINIGNYSNYIISSFLIGFLKNEKINIKLKIIKFIEINKILNLNFDKIREEEKLINEINKINYGSRNKLINLNFFTIKKELSKGLIEIIIKDSYKDNKLNSINFLNWVLIYTKDDLIEKSYYDKINSKIKEMKLNKIGFFSI